MAGDARYVDYIHLHKDFKDVFSLESDIEKESLWKERFIFTSDFRLLVDRVTPLFSPGGSNRKAVLLTGKYGVGKSHATGVLAHLLWDDVSSIKGTLEKARDDMAETGAGLLLFRESHRFFPVLLTARDSNLVRDARSFEQVLQVGLERALQKHGFIDRIAEKTEFEKYAVWFRDLADDPDRGGIRRNIEDELQKGRDYPSLALLIEALGERDPGALRLAEDLFGFLHLTKPWHGDTISYYRTALEVLRRADPSVAGIIIYWDEFTTVFNTAGTLNDANLIGAIQTWAEQVSNDIVLLLVSHRSPEQFRGLYKVLDDHLARIMDRFAEANFRMTQLTTFHLIAESLQVPDRVGLGRFLAERGFGDNEFLEMMALCNQLTANLCRSDDKVIRKTIPLHVYATYVAAKIADLIGSAERSIFKMIYDDVEEETGYGTRIGFRRFLETEPQRSGVAWYSIDRVFDYFYPDLADNVTDLQADPNVAKPLNAFKHHYAAAQQCGEDALRVFKTVVLLDMMNAKTGDPHLLPTKTNILNAFAFTDLRNVPALLERLVEKPVLMTYDDDRTGAVIYKTRFGGYDDEELRKIRDNLQRTYPFEKFIEHYKGQIENAVVSRLSDLPRITNRYLSIHVLGEEGFRAKERTLLEKDGTGEASLVILVPETPAQFERLRQSAHAFALKAKNAIVLLNEAEHERTYGRWLDAFAQQTLAQTRASGEMLAESQRQLKSVETRLVENLAWFLLNFRQQQHTRSAKLDKVQQCLTTIYPRGFDFIKYDQLWGSPKKQTRELFAHYDKPDGRQTIEKYPNYVVTKIKDIFRTEDGDWLVDARLRLKEEQAADTGLAECVHRIRQYVEDRNGRFVSIRGMINELGIERPPYGLRGWIEALVIAYALAPFDSENRLEVRASNGSPTKDFTIIAEAINAAIKSEKAPHEIRYGSAEENRLAKRLRDVFDISQDKKSLADVVVHLREHLKNQCRLPLWVLPFALDPARQAVVRPFVDQLNVIVVTTITDKEFDEDEVKEALRTFEEVERSLTGRIWRELFDPQTFENGFSVYVKNLYPSLLSSYRTVGDLVVRIKNELQEDVFIWTDGRVTETLARLNRSSTPPGTPSGFSLSQEDDGDVVLVWNPPLTDGPLADHYEIVRRDDGTGEKTTGRTQALETRYKDRSAEPGHTYSYSVIAVNPAGASAPTAPVQLRVVLPPPALQPVAVAEEDAIAITWPAVRSAEDLRAIEILRGPSRQELELLVSSPPTATGYRDTSAEPGSRYVYGICAVNILDQRGQISASPLVRIPRRSAPPAPSSFQAQRVNGEIRLRWDPPRGADEEVESYCVFRADAGGAATEIDAVPAQQAEFTDRSALPGVLYEYSLAAANRFGRSEPVRAPAVNRLLPLPPLTLTTDDTEEGVRLVWPGPDPRCSVVRYDVLRGGNDGELRPIATLPADVCQYLDASARPGKRYAYSLSAVNEDGTERRLDDPVTVVRAVKVDVPAWEELGRALFVSEPRLFLSTIRHLIREAEAGALPEDVRLAVARIGEAIEELPDA